MNAEPDIEESAPLLVRKLIQWLGWLYEGAISGIPGVDGLEDLAKSYGTRHRCVDRVTFHNSESGFCVLRVKARGQRDPGVRPEWHILVAGKAACLVGSTELSARLDPEMRVVATARRAPAPWRSTARNSPPLATCQLIMARVAARVTDKRMLKLIRAFLKSGVMEDGLVSPVDEGTPQGGPLSPLLSNLVLDDLDKELARRVTAFAATPMTATSMFAAAAPVGALSRSRRY